jgi:hypothetical protein
MIESRTGLESQILDGQVEPLEVGLVEVGKQGEMAHAAIFAFRLSPPRRQDSCRFHRDP